MSPLQRLFANGHAKPARSEEVETAVSEVLREAEELCQLLRVRREQIAARPRRSSIAATD
jgi:hypothetical protein